MAIRVGKEKRVNTHNSGLHFDQEVARLADGGWVVTWTSSGQDVGSTPYNGGTGVYAQIFNADGSKRGSEISVNEYKEDSQQDARVAALDDGGWVVVWASTRQAAFDLTTVYQKVYAANGTVVYSEGRVFPTLNDGAYDDVWYPVVSALAGGGWVVAAETNPSTPSTPLSAWVQAYSSVGDPVGVPGEVGTSSEDAELNGTTVLSRNYSITPLKNGGWVVLWESASDADGSEIYQQVFKSNGTKSGGETRVNQHTAMDQIHARTTLLKSGGWVVTWWSEEQDGDHYGIYQTVFDASGSRVVNEARVNKTTNSVQWYQDVTALSDGGWIVTWTSGGGQDGAGYGVYLQAYNANGSKRGGEKQVNTSTAQHQQGPQIAELDDGGWVVVWKYDFSSATDQDAVYLQVFNSDGSRRGGEVKVGDESSAGGSAKIAVTATGGGNFVVTWHDYASSKVLQRVYKTVEDLNMVGTSRNNTLKGDWGNDTIAGRAGSDKLLGFDGKDVLKGGSGADLLKGGAGHDKLLGGKGRDTLVGNGGRDKFVFDRKEGTDVIQDFQNKQDKLDLGGFHFKNKKAALAHFSEWRGQHDDKVKFDYKGTHIKIKGVDLVDIDGSDILI